MALRCLIRLINKSNPIIRSSTALSSIQCRNYSILSGRNKVLIDSRNLVHYANIRSKSYDKKSSSSSKEEDEGSDDEFDDVDKKTMIKKEVQSLRADLLLKTAIGMSRNKVEDAFYDNRIRINGKKITKKSVSCSVGDELDLIKNESAVNPNHIVIARIEIVDTSPRENGIAVTMRRFKNLTIEKYSD